MQEDGEISLRLWTLEVNAELKIVTMPFLWRHDESMAEIISGIFEIIKYLISNIQNLL